jgi:uracil-DNA glycosylase family 4
MNDSMSLKEIFCEAKYCQRCYPGEKIYVPLPDPKNSDGKSEILFINERPGRIGTGQSGYISFDNDDPSANFFRECFQLAGLARNNVFITNACLCHPSFEGYTDTAPKLRELKNCHFWLQKQIEIAQPKLIITVGRVAFESVLRYLDQWPISSRTKFLDAVGKVVRNTNPWVYPLSHTSRLGRVNRKAELQKQDWLNIPKVITEINNAT